MATTNDSEFFKFPRTPHLLWLSNRDLRDDKLLDADERSEFIDSPVVVEEKIDGANVGLSFDQSGNLQIQNRGSYLDRGAHPQFEPIWNWAYSRIDALRETLADSLILFGEWCYAVHSVHYTSLPSWFLAFDIYASDEAAFFSTDRRNQLLEEMDIDVVPELARGKFNLEDFPEMIGPSAYSEKDMEGIYIRIDDDGCLKKRAKVVRADFVEDIDEHWKSGELNSNSLASG